MDSFLQLALQPAGCFFFAVFAIIGQIFSKKEKNNKTEQALFFINIFVLISVIMTIAGQSSGWIPGIYRGDTSSFRAFTYTRYFGIFVSPLVMSGLIYYEQLDRARQRKIGAVAFLGTILITLVWVTFVLPGFTDEAIKEKSYYMLYSQGLMKNNAAPKEANWILVSFQIIEVSVLWMVLLIKEKKEACYILFAGLLLFSRIYVYNNWTSKVENDSFKKVDAGMVFIEKAEQAMTDNVIYVNDASDSKNHQIFYLYQYYNFSKKVIPGLPAETNNILVFSNRDIHESFPSCWWIKLDNNEYVFGTDLQMYDSIKELEYEVHLCETEEG